jgi:predicted DNA-binding transcriptional regulator YafY
MAKEQSTPLEQTARMLDLVPFLLAHQGISITDLAAHFKVEKDVILDDLSTLWMCGLPGYTPLELIDLAFDSGYVTIRNAAPLARVRTLSSSEIVSLTLGLDLLREASFELSSDAQQRIVALSAKLREIIGADISIQDNSQTAFRSVIARAIKERCSADISYFSPVSDRQSERTVTPYHFLTEGGVEYFQGYCHNSKAIRTFRLDRIRAATFSELSEKLENISAASGEKVRALAAIHSLDRATVESFGLALSQIQGLSSITVEAFSAQWMERSVMASGGGVELQEPENLRGAIAKSIEATMALYEEGAIA